MPELEILGPDGNLHEAVDIILMAYAAHPKDETARVEYYTLRHIARLLIENEAHAERGNEKILFLDPGAFEILLEANPIDLVVDDCDKCLGISRWVGALAFFSL